MPLVAREQVESILVRNSYRITPMQYYAPQHIIVDHVGLPLKRKGPLCLSMGLESSGGPYLLGKPFLRPEKLEENLLKVLREALAYCGILLVTLSPRHNLLHTAATKLMNRLGNSVRVGTIYPRIVDVRNYKGFDDFYRTISKKARNRHRYFRKMGGYVENAPPSRHVHDMLRVNLSQPVRQGRLLPPSYLDERLLKEQARLWQKDWERGILAFTVAKIKGRLVGYAVVPKMGGWALFSRFMVDRRYYNLGTGNALILETMRMLWGEARIFQYGYWRNKNPTINSFLEKNGFKAGVEEILMFTRPPMLLTLAPIARIAVSISNVIKPNQATLLTRLESKFKKQLLGN